MEKKGDHCIVSLGASKVAYSALNPMFSSGIDTKVICVSHSGKNIHRKHVEYEGFPEAGYEITPYNGEKTLDEISNNVAGRSNIIIIPNDLELLHNVISDTRTVAIFSTCREGLYTTYLEVLKKIKREMLVISLDNDETIIKEACKRCNNTAITFCKGTLHSLCTLVEFPEETDTIVVHADTDIELVLPPESLRLKKYFEFGAGVFSLRGVPHFAETQKEYNIRSNLKIVDINGIHALISLLAYRNGFQRGHTTDVIANKNYEEYLSLDEAIRYSLKAHEQMYTALVSDNDDEDHSFSEEREAHKLKMVRFVSKIYETGDKIKRGIDFNSVTSLSKVKRHITYLSKVRDDEINDCLNYFERKLQDA